MYFIFGMNEVTNARMNEGKAVFHGRHSNADAIHICRSKLVSYFISLALIVSKHSREKTLFQTETER